MMKMTESVTTCGCIPLQALRAELKVAIDSISDEKKLKACLNLLHGAERMPCCYTEDELDELVRRSEAGGYASTEEVHELFAKWGVYM